MNTERSTPGRHLRAGPQRGDPATHNRYNREIMSASRALSDTPIFVTATEGGVGTQANEYSKERHLNKNRSLRRSNRFSRSNSSTMRSNPGRYLSYGQYSCARNAILEGSHRETFVVDGVPTVLHPRLLQPRKYLFVFRLAGDIQRRSSSLVSLRRFRAVVVWRHQCRGCLCRSPTTATITTNNTISFSPRTGNTLLTLLRAPFPFLLTTLTPSTLFTCGLLTIVRRR